MRVGIRAVQDVLSKATQSNLSMFHNAGNVTSDSVFPKPSISDVIDVSPSMLCSMNFKISHPIKKGDLVGLTFNDILKSFSIFNEIDEDEPENIWYSFGKYTAPKLFLRCYIDAKLLLSMGYTLETVATQTFNDYDCCLSPDFMGIIDIVLEDTTELQNIFARFDTVLGGSFKIKDAVLIDDTVYTVGSDISLLLDIEQVLKATIVSNDINEVTKIYGIEAGRKVIQDLLDNDLLAKFMTRSGEVSAINKNNLSQYNRGFITDISYERIRYTLTKHLGSSIIDPLDSIYAKIWAGKHID
jgi:RNA polymerase Rpb1, domain 5